MILVCDKFDDVLDVLGQAFSAEASWVAVPADKLPDGFFVLRTGVAGEILQKFVNYRIGLAVIGDISQYTAKSNALRDLVVEYNKGHHAWFLPTIADLEARLV